MTAITEKDARKAEQYRAICLQSGKHSEGLAGYVTIACGALLFGAFFFGVGSSSFFLPGLAAAGFVGGGLYWLHVRKEIRRLWDERRAIEAHFQARGMRVHSDGQIEP